jgi:hypothetical protein
MTRGGLLLGVAGLVGMGACSPRDNGTLLVVRVDTDFAVPGELNKIAIDVVPDGHAKTTDDFPIASRASLPLTYGIRPRGAPDFGVQVTARGILGAAPVVSRTATARFVAGEAREFTLQLTHACAATPASCPSENATLRPYVPAGTDGGSGSSDGPTDAGMREARPNPGHFVTVASPSPTAALNSVYALGPDDVWVVGALGTSGVAYHFQQNAWTSTPFPSTTTLYGVWASATDNVWTVGVAGTIALYDGTTWTTTQLSASGPGSIPPTLTAVWGSGPDDVWIVGAAGTIVHATTGGPIVTQTVGTSNLAAVSGTGPDEAWAVGNGGAVLRRHNNAWTPQTQTLTQSALYGVWLSGPSDVWVVGLGLGGALHFDGGSWTKVPTPLAVPLAVWGSAPDDVWSVGSPAMPTGTPFVARFDGVAWGAVDIPGMTPLQAVRGSSATDVWAVGGGGVVLHLQIP